MGNGASADVSNDTCYDILEFEKNQAFFFGNLYAGFYVANFQD